MAKAAPIYSVPGLFLLLALIGLAAAAPVGATAGPLLAQETSTAATTATATQVAVTDTPTLKGADATLVPTITLTPSPTPLPADYLQTEFQTTGLVLGAIVLVIIIVGGTLLSIRRRR